MNESVTSSAVAVNNRKSENEEAGGRGRGRCIQLTTIEAGRTAIRRTKSHEERCEARRWEPRYMRAMRREG